MKLKYIFLFIFRVLIFNVAFSVIMSGSASAMQMMVKPSFNMALFHDDNYYLESSEPVESWGSVTSLGISMIRNTEYNSMYFKGVLNVREFSNDQIIDTVDESFSTGYNHIFETQTLGIDAFYNNETTTIYELGTNGGVRTGKQSVKEIFKPSWKYLFSDTDSMAISFLHTNTDYDALPTELADYHYEIWNVSYNKKLSEKYDFSLRYSRSVLEVDDIGIVGLPGVASVTITNSIFTEFNRKFSETFRAGLQIGVRRTEETTIYYPLPGNPETKSEGDKPLFIFDMTKEFETTRINIAASRLLAPSGNASLNENDNLDLGLHWDITEKNSADLRVSFLKIKSGTTSIDNDSISYLTVEPQFSRRINLNWKISTNYRYREQTINQAGVSTYSRGLFFKINYIYSH